MIAPLAALLWTGAVHTGAARTRDVRAIAPVKMVNGCPDLGDAGLDYDRHVVRNPQVRRQLEALRCGLTLEGFPPGVVDVVVSGGDSFVGRDGRVYSASTGRPISQRKRNSAHNVQNGARAIDLWRDGRINDKQFYAVMKKYTAFRSPEGHGPRHRHLSLGRDFDCPREICVRRIHSAPH